MAARLGSCHQNTMIMVKQGKLELMLVLSRSVAKQTTLRPSGLYFMKLNTKCVVLV